jgi:hypothetical protein
MKFRSNSKQKFTPKFFVHHTVQVDHPNLQREEQSALSQKTSKAVIVRRESPQWCQFVRNLLRSVTFVELEKQVRLLLSVQRSYTVSRKRGHQHHYLSKRRKGSIVSLTTVSLSGINRHARIKSLISNWYFWPVPIDGPRTAILIPNLSSWG